MSPSVHTYHPLERFFPAILFLLFLVVSSCEKEDLKEPTRVDITFQVKEGEASLAGNGGGPPVSIEANEGEMAIEKIRVIGERKEGKDVDFVREEGLEISLEDEDHEAGPKTYFDIPQGTYEDLQLLLTLSRNGEEVLELEGMRIQDPPSGPAQATPFRLMVEDDQELGCSVGSPSGKDRVELKKEEDRTIQVKILKKNWFKGMGRGQWNQASVDSTDGPSEIPIQQGNNASLHSKFLERIENGFKAEIL